MSVSLTADTINQGLSYGALAAVIAGVPPEVALGSLAGAVIFVTSAVEYPVRRRVLLSLVSFSLRASLLQTNILDTNRDCQHDTENNTGLF